MSAQTAAAAAVPDAGDQPEQQPIVTDASAPIKCGEWVANESQLACTACQGTFTVINR
jgi:hypothetical protein